MALSLVAVMALAARVFGILLFGSALWSKLAHFGEFSAIVARYVGIGVRLAVVPAGIVTAGEAAVVLLLLLPGTGAAGAGLAIALLLAFAGAMAVALMRGETELECGCNQSALKQRVRPALILRNMALAILFAPLVTVGAGAVAAPTLDGIAAGLALFVLNLALGVFIALDDSFAELKRRYG